MQTMFNPESPPELHVQAWLNTSTAITLQKLKGRVVLLLAFQMLCPGCVSHAIPQAKKFAERFSSDEVAIIGLHTAFEHHDVMTLQAVKAFNHQYRLPFPVGVDMPNGDRLPLTMDAYEMRGTPTLLLFDRQGRLRRHYLGQVDDVRLAAELMALALEARDASREASIAIERGMSAVLIDPEAPPHVHGPDCGHDHASDHVHDTAHDEGAAHVHGPGCNHDDHAAPATTKRKSNKSKH
jgi:peroxiredoxin